MAKQIKDLTAAASALTTDQYAIDNASNVTKKVTGTQIITMVGDPSVATQAHGTVSARTTTTETVVLADGGKTLTFTNGSATTFTVPANASVAFPIGTRFDLASLGAGIVTVAVTTDTLISKGSKVTLTGRYSVGSLIKTAATTWLLAGDLA